MSVKNELLKMIDERYQKFSKGQKKLADFIREDYDKAAFLTAAKMGEEVGVSESTVVRFATALGYDGYPEFQKALGELVRMKLNSIQRMEVTYGRISQGEILASVLHSDIDQLILRNSELNHGSNLVATLREHLLQSLSLWCGTWETIEDDTCVILTEAVVYASEDVDHQLVWNPMIPV